MTGAPTWVDDAQLNELGIDLTADSRLRRSEDDEDVESDE